MVGPVAAVAKAGLAVGYALQDSDVPSMSAGYLVRRGNRGGPSAPAAIPSAQQVLDISFAGSKPQLLVGTSPSNLACCSMASLVSAVSGGRFSRPQTITDRLNGATIGHLVSLGDRTLAAVATDEAVWVAQSGSSARLGPTHRLTSPQETPQAMTAAPLSHGGAIVAWSSSKDGGPSAGRIFTASGSQHAAPKRGRLAVRAGRGHSVDELGLVASNRAPALAWVESWFDRRGNYRSQVEVRDLLRKSSTRSLAVGGAVASGLSFAGDVKGMTQVLAWKTCTESGSCSVQVAVRRRNRTFSKPARLGAIDPEQVPSAAVAPSGTALVGWIDGGHVLAAALTGAGTRFGANHVVSATRFADSLTLAYGANGQAVAAWSQGTYQPEVVAATYR